jgi:hypothetical protein
MGVAVSRRIDLAQNMKPKPKLLHKEKQHIDKAIAKLELVRHLLCRDEQNPDLVEQLIEEAAFELQMSGAARSLIKLVS